QDDIHPKNKQEVGRRLALVAEAKTYGRKIPYYGPTYKSMKIEGNSVRLTFDHTEGGLTTRNNEPVQGFALAGQDHIWCWADGNIEGNSVVLSTPLVKD